MIVALTSAASTAMFRSARRAFGVAANSDLTFVEFGEGNGFEASAEDVAVSVCL
jgi:hypothetical protein